MQITDYNTSYFPTWCPGCGDFGIWGALKSAFTKIGWTPSDFAIVFGIGCSGNMNDFLKCYAFHALHGRAIPTAVGIKIANHKLPVLVVAGDGDCYGEGGNHLMHAARGNHDITVVIHDNRVYGLTTGQTSPTSPKGYKSKSTPDGVIEVPVNPLAYAITSGATFVAQAFAGDIVHTAGIIEEGVRHKGFSLVNILQPCISFNKVNTYPWYRERVYKLGEEYDKRDKMKALEKSFFVADKIPTGIFYEEDRLTYTDSLTQLSESTLLRRSCGLNLEKILDEYV